MRAKTTILLAALLVLFAASSHPTEAQAGVTITVNSAADTKDAYGPDDVCDTANHPNTEPPTAPSGICTLRAALEQANATGGNHAIVFSISGSGPHVISPGKAFPVVGAPVTIDGYTQSGATPNTNPPDQGTNAVLKIGIENFGLLLTIGGSRVRGLALVGLTMQGTGGNLVEGNFLGTDVSGGILTTPSSALYITSGDGNLIGGTTPAARNLIASGAFGSGITLSGIDDTIIQGNLIGTKANGTEPLGEGSGIFLSGSNPSNNTIGGTTPEERNVISGNGTIGVILTGTTNKVTGNFIGTDVSGTAAVGNGTVGVRVVGSGHTVGGTTGTNPNGPCAGPCNVIAANGSHGVELRGSSSNNKVQGNFIGTTVDGNAALGNGGHGVYAIKSTFNSIGGSTPDARNIIAASGGDGVRLLNGSEFNRVRGNYIGTGVTGKEDFGSTGHGVYVVRSGSNTIESVPGVPPGSGAEQIIALNDGDGVFIEDGTANKVWSNSIHSNSGLGIDLLPDGVTFNDSDDGDIGANDLQNFPVVTSVKTNEDPAQTVIKGRLTSAAGTSYRIEFFANTECDPSGFGEGERFLGSDTAASDTDGNAAFQLTVSEVVSNITLTATNLDTGDTSEFSRCGAPIQVNSVGDDGDADLSDGACDTGATVSRDGASEPECTLRAAIQTANNNAGPDVIAFDIPSKGPHDIQLTGGHSDLADPVTIDGTTEPDFTNVPVVKIDGSAAGPDVDGLRMTGGNSTVRGVIIARFKGNGIEITSSGNTVEGSFIGPGQNDTPLAANGGHGVYISSGASNNTISGSFISGNEGDGVKIERPDTTGNTVQGSFIGTDMDGSAAVPNQGDGVHIGDGATNNTVGGDTVSAGNVISGNMGDGVEIEGSGTTGNKLRNNLIGTNASGNDKLADSKSNAGHGVFINDAPNNTVGGSGNVISGNGMNGVLVSGQTATGNSVKGNQIGTDKDDINELGNAQNGVEIRGAPGNTVGGTVVDEGNIISANRLAGVLITGAGATGNLVHGNIIGTDNIGVVDLGNGGSGVQITGSADNTIGGTDEGAGNVISGNVKHGVEIAGDRNRVQDNFIGTTRDGTGPMPNDMNGVVVEGSDNLIDEGNLISGNLLGGVVIKGSDSSRNKVEGNHIGTDVSGGQGLGNGQDGVRIAEGASDKRGRRDDVGGSQPDLR